jgi:hypothetical protein
MPDPLLYTQAFFAASATGALLLLLIGWACRPKNAYRGDIACIVAIAAAHAVGYYVLQLRIGWPPASALDRWIVVLLPAVLIVELFACAQRVPQNTGMILRLLLAASIGRVLLHGSVYLQGNDVWKTDVSLVLCAVLTGAAWLLLVKLHERSPGISISLSLALAIQCAGVSIMLAGYLKGGAAAIIATAALFGATLAQLRPTSPSLIGVGVASLASMLTIGVYFGRLPPLSALALACAPLFCLTTEIPWLKKQRPWIVGTTPLILVTLVGAIVLLCAKYKFDLEMAPLL